MMLNLLEVVAQIGMAIGVCAILINIVLIALYVIRLIKEEIKDEKKERDKE